MALAATDFGAFFEEVNGRPPFAWQSELAARVLGGGWPRAIAMPTGSGKTSVMDIAAFHLALEAGRPGRRAPLRTVFVVDRRLVVDDAFAHACLLAERIASRAGPVTGAACESFGRAFGAPLRAARLRGGVPGDDGWAERPDVPLLMTSTVDQAGSRLLFRGYGVSDSMRPVHAGLLGTDALYVLDEADSSAQFLETLGRVVAMRAREGGAGGPPLAAVYMGATVRRGAGTFPPAGDMGRLLSADAALARRMGAHKRARLVEAGGRRGVAEVMAAEAVRLSRLPGAGGGPGARRVGVVANTVNTARRVFGILRGAAQEGGAGVHLLTGRARPLDRDRFAGREIESIRPGGRGGAGRAAFFVSTQCIEAGVDVDFDALVTQLAPLDSLRQRFGRLDRIGERGESEAAIVADRAAVSRGSEDPVYGDGLPATWEFLRGRAAGGAVDFGVAHLGAEGILEGAAEGLAAPRPAPVSLMPSHVRALARTRPRSDPDPGPSVFLHGRGPGQADVRIIWRADVEERMLREGAAPEGMPGLLACPPSSLEAAPVPVWAARAWLAGSAADAWDVEGPAGGAGRAGRGHRRVLVWRGARDAGTRTASGGDIGPGDTVVVPASYGGCDKYGWDAGSAAPVEDVGMAANLVHRGRLAVRLERGAVEAAGGAWDEISRAAAAHAGDRGAAGLVAELSAVGGLPEGWAEAMALAQRAGAPRAVLAGEGGGRRVAALVWDGLGAGLAGRILGALGMADAAPARAGAEAAPAPGRGGRREVGLAEHCRGVQAAAEGFCRRMGMDAGAAGDVSAAALLHDIGKAEPRFQAYLRGLDPDDLLDGRLLAKGGRPAGGPADLALRRRRARLPDGQRHECWSVALADGCPELAGARDPDLVRYLIGTHHGHGRPAFPPVGGGPDGAWFELGGGRARLPAGCLAGPDHEWADIRCSVAERYGPWSLAHMEAVLRLADHRVSREGGAAPGARPAGPQPPGTAAARWPGTWGPAKPRAGGIRAAPADFALPGLRDDSLLSFLALVGAMRLLDEARPGWRPRAYWRGRHPVIRAEGCAGEADLLGAMAGGLEAYGARMARVPHRDLRMSVAEFGRMQNGIDPEIASALGSDGCAQEGGAMPQYTPLCMVSGAGHQHFLESLKAATRAGAGGRAGVAREIGESLLARRPPAGRAAGRPAAGRPAFRWDPSEYRPHAHRGRSPARERPSPPPGANRLAAVGFTMYDCVPTPHGLCTASYIDGNAARNAPPAAAYDGKEYALWPVWGRPLSAAAVSELMHYPYARRILAGGAGVARDMRAYGVDRIMRAEVFRDGRYRNVRLAAPVP